MQVRLSHNAAIMILEILEGEIKALEEDDQQCPDLISAHAQIIENLRNEQPCNIVNLPPRSLAPTE